MTTTIELPDEQVLALDRYCEQQKLTRAQAISQAVERLVPSKIAPELEPFFGLWKDIEGDSRLLVEKLRTEWDHR